MIRNCSSSCVRAVAVRQVDPLHDESAATPTAALHTPDAERRQVTVLFGDLVDSTQLAQQLDPEDYRSVVRAYQEAVVTAIQPFDGHVGQYLGDGLLLYFGWPQAHEDAVVRAVHASLAIIAALVPLNARVEPRYGVRVAVRLGLHTGLTVIGRMGSGARQEQLAMGDTPNIAARLQGLAAPDTVVLSAATARLVQGVFALQEMGIQTLKGVAEPMPVWRVVGASTMLHDDEDVGLDRILSFLVGRDEEVGLLLRRRQQSQEGVGQVVLVSGEAGIGKSALVGALRQHVRHDGALCLTLRCSPYHIHSTLYPIITHVQRILHVVPEDTAEGRLTKLERALGTYRQPLTELVPLLAALLAVPLPEGRYAPLTLTPQQQRQQTLDALVAWWLEEAERQPVLAVYEDLHWADPSTLELLGMLVEQAPTASMLHVLTALAHPQSLAYAHHCAALLHQRRREAPAVQAQADALLTLATAQGLPLWVGFGTRWRGWALALQGQVEAGLVHLRQGLAAVLATGQTLGRPTDFVLLAEVMGHTGQVVEGLRLLAEALVAFEASGRGDALAEAYRLQGELLMQQSKKQKAKGKRQKWVEAEACFQQALTIARQQQAKSWELRTATSLSRLWQQQGKRDAARELLASIYSWFTEGFDTADLQEARALLEALA